MRGGRLKPRVITRSVADSHASAGERIIEVSFADGSGCLISLRQPDGDRRARVEVYRTDERVRVVAPPEDAAREAGIDAGALDYEADLDEDEGR